MELVVIVLMTVIKHCILRLAFRAMINSGYQRCGNSSPNNVSPNHVSPKTFHSILGKITFHPITYPPIHVSPNTTFHPNYVSPNFFILLKHPIITQKPLDLFASIFDWGKKF